MIDYVGTLTALTPLAGDPHAVFRVTLEKTGGALAYWIGDWPTVVAHTAERATQSGFGIALGGPRPSSQDRTAIVDFRAPTFGATGASVGDLVTAIDAASVGSRVVRVQRLDPVPPFGSAAESDRAAAAEAEQARAEQDAASRTIGARISAALGSVRQPVIIGLASGIVLLGLYYFGRRTGGGSQVWTGDET